RAIPLATEILGASTAGDGFRGWAHMVLGQHRLRRDNLEEAAAHLQKAVELSNSSPLRRLHASSLQVHLLLRQKQAEAARSLAEALLGEAAARGGGGYCAPALELAAICARFIAGDQEGVVTQHRATTAEVMRRAALFPEASSRSRYLRELEEN